MRCGAALCAALLHGGAAAGARLAGRGRQQPGRGQAQHGAPRHGAADAGGILAGFVTSFITAAVELSATILLTSAESQAPMSYGIYLYMQSVPGAGRARRWA
jgi:hypothetical protein